MSALDRFTDAALILGASARLTRFVTVDDLGQWWIREPLHRRFVNTSAEKYLIGLHCPHCAGFHASLVVIATYALARLLHLLPVWRVVAGALAVNYVTAHVVSQLDPLDEEDAEEETYVEEENSETSLPPEFTVPCSCSTFQGESGARVQVHEPTCNVVTALTPPPPAAIGETVHVMDHDVCIPGVLDGVLKGVDTAGVHPPQYLASIRCEQEDGNPGAYLCAYDNGRAPVTEHEELLGIVYYPHGDRWFSTPGWHLVEECPTAQAEEVSS